jgi:hypothetical protein
MPVDALSPDPRGLMAPGRTMRDAFVAWAEHKWGAWTATL